MLLYHCLKKEDKREKCQSHRHALIQIHLAKARRKKSDYIKSKAAVRARGSNMSSCLCK